MTKSEAKTKLTDLGIEFDPKATVTDLLKLINGSGEEVGDITDDEVVNDNIINDESINNENTNDDVINTGHNPDYSGIKIVSGRFITKDGSMFDDVNSAAEYNGK
jgi:hypothetical protein